MIRGKSLTVMSLLFWLIVFFRKKVPAKGLDPASQALLSSWRYCNHRKNNFFMSIEQPMHNGFWRVWNLAKKFGKFLYKNLPIYKEKTWQKWSSVDPHCSLVTHSAKGRFKWKNWLFIMPFCHLLSTLAAFLIANCDFWLKTTWLTFLKRFMTENWPKQKKSKKVSTRDRTGDLLCGSLMW